jgi:two-component system chemotaxis response regulator CheB
MMLKKPITIFVVDDSVVSRNLMIHLIESDPDLKVMGTAANGEEALNWLKDHTPDVITMDIFMPKIDGFEVTRRIMEIKPIPILIISSAYTPKDTEKGFKAMENGALAILEKPFGSRDEEYKLKSQEMIQTIKMISEVKLIKRRSNEFTTLTPSPIKVLTFKEQVQAIGIGASLGGPPALATILSQLPSPFSVPIFIVQHITSGFIQGFVSWIQTCTSLSICLPKDGEIARPGHVYVAPDDCHMRIQKGNVIALNSIKKVQPSVDPLFYSMSTTYERRGVGVILTGMGKDGAQGLLEMKKRGAYTIAQDEQSCTMFGMPREAITIGAVRQVVPLDQIASLLRILVNKV